MPGCEQQVCSCLRHLQVFAVSSAGAVFKLMGAVPPLSLAAWRLQLTTLLLLPGCVVNFRGLTPGMLSYLRF